MRLIFSALIFFIVNFFLVQNTAAKIFLVNDSGDTDLCTETCTLRGAIEVANTNNETDVITISPTIEKINLVGELLIKGNDSPDTNVDMTINGTAIIDAQKTGRIFAIAKNAHVVINNLRITNGYLSASSTLQGAGIHNQGILELFAVKIYQNNIEQNSLDKNTTIRGAGIYNGSTASLYLINSEIGPRNGLIIKGKDVEAQGAGIYNANKLTILNSTIFNNYAFTSSKISKGSANARGGGIYSTAIIRTDIEGSSIYGNKVETTLQEKTLYGKAQGAGMYLESSSKFYITNSTISGNEATSYGYTNAESFVFAHGGAIYAGAYSKTYLANVTVAKNTVKVPTIANSDAAGVSVGHTFFVVNVPGTDFKIKNSIIASEGKNCIYSIKSDGNNVISDNSCFTPISGDKINTNPLLFPLEFNGGPTKTHRLAPTSPAKDAGNKYGCFDYLDKLLFQDQRGYFRPKMRCDSGAFEL